MTYAMSGGSPDACGCGCPRLPWRRESDTTAPPRSRAARARRRSRRSAARRARSPGAAGQGAAARCPAATPPGPDEPHRHDHPLLPVARDVAADEPAARRGAGVGRDRPGDVDALPGPDDDADAVEARAAAGRTASGPAARRPSPASAASHASWASRLPNTASWLSRPPLITWSTTVSPGARSTTDGT